MYSHEPFCGQVLEAGYGFIFTYRDKTHQWLTETVKNSEPGERTKREWNGWHHKVYTCRRVNGALIRYAEQEEQALKVNRLELSIWNEEKRKRTFCSSWITDTEIRAENVKHLADCGRAVEDRKRAQ